VKRPTSMMLLAWGVCAASAGCAPDTLTAPPRPSLSIGNPVNAGSKNPYTLAVIGDTPYGAAKLAEFPSLIALINSDPKVDVVVHLGDIKTGTNSPCTDEYFANVKVLFDGFKDPFVYTPGDNEWTDCHVAGTNNGLYTPTERLQAVRDLFFPVAGQSLGGRKKQLLTQADDPANSAYVENTMWMESQVVFAAVNVPGSNNDRAPWGSQLPADAADFPSQSQEQASRAQATSAWLERAFAIATENDAAAVVVLMQADMWFAIAPVTGYAALVQQIGTLAAAFGKPVLLLEGDSHAFRVDRPYSPSSPLFGIHPSTPVAENVTRVVVEGGLTGRTEYVRLTIDPQGQGTDLFTVERVPLQ
jgi:Calcineurin-like phosphoesterase